MLCDKPTGWFVHVLIWLDVEDWWTVAAALHLKGLGEGWGTGGRGRKGRGEGGRRKGWQTCRGCLLR